MEKTDNQDFTTKDMPRDARRKLGVGDIWSNSAECVICGEIIRSVNRNDFYYCKCGAVAVDGGSWYVRRVGASGHYVNHIEYYDDVV